MKVLTLATTSQSLVLQSPVSWTILKDMGAEITFAAAEDDWTPKLRELGEFVPLKASRRLVSGSHVQLHRDVGRLLTSQSWELVQFQTPIVSAVGRLHRRRLSAIPAVVYVAHGFHFHRDQPILQRKIVTYLELYLAGRCDALAVVSEEDYVDALAAGFGRRSKVFHLPGAGIDTRTLAAAGPIRPFERGHLLFVGELIPRKNPVRAVEAAVDLLRDGDPMPLVVIGEGPLKERVLAAAQPLIAAGLFTHIGRSEHVAGYMAGASLHLLPSWQEGVPRVVMEAMAAGTPTIAMSNRGTRELAARGSGTVLSRTSTVKDWSRECRALSGRRLDGAAITAVEDYDTARFAAAYSSLIASVGVART